MSLLRPKPTFRSVNTYICPEQLLLRDLLKDSWKTPADNLKLVSAIFHYF